MKQGRIIGFYKHRWVYFTISLSIMLIGIICVFAKGVQLDIQFKGGSLLKYTYDGTLDANNAGDVATKALGKPVSAQLTSDLATKQKRLVLTIAGNNGLEAKKQQGLDSALKAAFPNVNLKLSESSMVEAYYGRQFLINGMIAIALSALLVLLYVWVRFRMLMGGLSAGVMAIVALVHDIFVVFFTFVIAGIPIGDAFVAVALSIIGYSINDTIVIYDRIRENHRFHPELAVDKLTDLSISQSFMRSVATNTAVFISISLVYILAHLHSLESIKDFALPMAVGSISGCYSTICIAGPLWVMWKMHKKDKVLFSK